MAEQPSGWEDVEIELRVTVRVNVKPGEDFQGWMDRTPEDLAKAALWTGRSDPSNIDGYADLVGGVDIMEVDSD